jgi:hypothetical protein
MIDKAEILLMKDRVKNHISEHKAEYWVGSIVVVAGATYFVTRRVMTPQISAAPVFYNTVAPTFNNTVNLGGPMTKMVKRMSDGKMWETVTEAAKEAGCTLSKMSQHLNGHKEHVNGEIYKIVGVGTRG